MVMKEADANPVRLERLYRYLASTKNSVARKRIQDQINMTEAGANAELDNAYFLDFHWRNSETHILLHDIRIEVNGRVAQIDHIVIYRGGLWILESKSSKSGTFFVKKDGSAEISYAQYSQVTLPSPLAQVNRQKEVLLDFLKDLDMPNLKVDAAVLLNPSTTVKNKILPDGYTKADTFVNYRDKVLNDVGFIDTLKVVANFAVATTRIKIAEALLKANESGHSDAPPTSKTPQPKKENHIPKEIETICKRCGSKMVFRRAAKGKNKGIGFLGCSSYPKCRNIVNLV